MHGSKRLTDEPGWRARWAKPRSHAPRILSGIPFNAAFLLEGGGDIDFGQDTEALILEDSADIRFGFAIGRSIVISMAFM